MGPRAGRDTRGKSRPHRDSIPGPSSPYQVAIPTELPDYFGRKQPKSHRINTEKHSLKTGLSSLVYLLTAVW